MRFLNPFRRPDPSECARALARQGIERRKAKVRATCDDMRARMGMPAVEWPR